MRYLVDIDETICKTVGTDYKNSVPILERIEKINSLFDEGHEIIIWTGRGLSMEDQQSKITLLETYGQLKSWGVKFHRFMQKQITFDLLIDDKAIDSDSFFCK